MMIHGAFQAAVRGPVKILRQLPELPEKWFRGPLKDKGRLVESGAKAAAESIAWRLKQLKETDPEKTAVLSWYDSVGAATAYMDMLEYMARTFPELDIAVGVKTSNSVSGGSHYSGYYSRSGVNTLHPDDFMNFLDVEVDGVAHLLTVGRDGKKHDIALADYEDWYYEDMLYEQPDQIGEYFWDYPCIFIYTPWEEDEADEEEDGEESGGWDARELDTYELEQRLGKFPPGFWELFYVRNRRVFQAGGNTETFLKTVMQELFPGKTFHTEGREDRVFIWDDSGKEYFLGNMMECVEGSVCEEVCWNFPDGEEDDPWVPFA